MDSSRNSLNFGENKHQAAVLLDSDVIVSANDSFAHSTAALTKNKI